METTTTKGRVKIEELLDSGSDAASILRKTKEPHDFRTSAVAILKRVQFDLNNLGHANTYRVPQEIIDARMVWYQLIYDIMGATEEALGVELVDAALAALKTYLALLREERDRLKHEEMAIAISVVSPTEEIPVDHTTTSIVTV